VGQVSAPVRVQVSAPVRVQVWVQVWVQCRRVVDVAESLVYRVLELLLDPQPLIADTNKNTPAEQMLSTRSR